MAWFRRNKKESVMPEEVRDYYASEKRDRKGMAWLLAIATLVVTFLIAAALFFGGRWVYRAIFDDTATTQQEGQETSTEQPVANESTQPNNNQSSSTPSSNGNTSSTSTDQPNNPSPTTSSTGNTPATTPNTGPNELVNTGPGDEL